jgi:hypothetical protein
MLIDLASVIKPPCSKPDIAGRRPDQARDRMAFHIFRHIKAFQFDTHASSPSCLATSVLPTPVGPLEQISCQSAFQASRNPARADILIADRTEQPESHYPDRRPSFSGHVPVYARSLRLSSLVIDFGRNARNFRQRYAFNILTGRSLSCALSSVHQHLRGA